MNRPDFRDQTRQERVSARAERANLHYNTNLVNKIDFGCPNLINEDNFGILARTAVGMNIRQGHVIGLPGTNFNKISCNMSKLIITKQYRNPIDFLVTCRLNNWAIYSIDYIDQVSSALENLTRDEISNDIRNNRKIILFFGNESFGIPTDILYASARVLHIFMPGVTPSLNVSAAGAIAMHHISYLLTDKQ